MKRWVRNLTKAFGSNRAIDGVSFELSRPGRGRHHRPLRRRGRRRRRCVARHRPVYHRRRYAPAQAIRPRFASRITKRLQALAWRDWNHIRLRDALDAFRALSVEAFLEKHHG